jgi:hypothetical protein
VVSLQDIQQYVLAFDLEQASLLKKDDGFAAQISGENAASATETAPGTAESVNPVAGMMDFVPIDMSKFSDLELIEFETRKTTLKYKKQRYLNVSENY